MYEKFVKCLQQQHGKEEMIFKFIAFGKFFFML